MKRAAVIALLIALAPAPADACHRFRVWRYPTPQRCAVARAPVRVRVARLVHVARLPPERAEPPDKPIPDLDTAPTLPVRQPQNDEDAHALGIELLKSKMPPQ